MRALQQTQTLLGAAGARIDLRDGDQAVPAVASGLTDGCSRLVAPLQYQSQTLGSITVFARQPTDAFDDRDRASLEVIASLLGQALGQSAALAQRDQAALAARQTAERLAAILRAATELAIVGTDLDGRVIVFNEGAERMLGYTADEVLGRRAAGLLHDPREVAARIDALGVSHEEVFVGAARRGAASTQEWTYRRKDGSRLTVSLSLTGMRDETGTLIGYLGVAIDITERKAVDRMKDELISVVSHELRTPLAGIRAALGLLAGGVLGPLPDRGQRMLELAVRNADRLGHLLDDILDLEQLRQGQIGLDKQPVPLDEVLLEARDLALACAAEAGVDLAVEPIETVVRLDRRRLVQVLTALLDNAIRFSSAGSTVYLRARADAAARTVCIEVQDHGGGIQPEQLERIFTPFHQADASDTRARGGTGLGLAICREIVALHAGRIWAESTPGAGSRLLVELPLEA